MNPKYVLIVATHLKDEHDNETNIGAFSAALNFLKYYIVKFGQSYVEFVPLFKSEMLLALIDISLEEIDLLNECTVSEQEIGYIYKRNNSYNREFFQDGKKRLVHTSVPKKKISKTAKFEGSNQVKEKLIKQLK